MFWRIKSRGLKISAELHRKVSASGAPINNVDSEIVAIRSLRKRASRMTCEEEFHYIYDYGCSYFAR